MFFQVLFSRHLKGTKQHENVFVHKINAVNILNNSNRWIRERRRGREHGREITRFWSRRPETGARLRIPSTLFREVSSVSPHFSFPAFSLPPPPYLSSSPLPLFPLYSCSFSPFCLCVNLCVVSSSVCTYTCGCPLQIYF